MKKFILSAIIILFVGLVFANDFQGKVYEFKNGAGGYQNFEFQFSEDVLFVLDTKNGVYSQYSFEVVGRTLYLEDLENPNFIDFLKVKTIQYSLKDGTAILELVIGSEVLTLYDIGIKQYRSDLAFGIIDKTAVAAALIAGTSYSNLNRKYYEVKGYVNNHDGEAPAGFRGGRQFKNYKKILPITGKDGNAIIYKEYDVNMFVKGVDRGAERLVMGSDGRAYKTVDHYTSFQRIF